ncbi:hypothetical protein Dip510_001831 [Elusimicrobium posterum]|uniref:hypothetical protein n=1 Tax=Elusimicrobium posterum TaxID=3116653 RepID=UPI003C754A71
MKKILFFILLCVTIMPIFAKDQEVTLNKFVPASINVAGKLMFYDFQLEKHILILDFGFYKLDKNNGTYEGAFYSCSESVYNQMTMGFSATYINPDIVTVSYTLKDDDIIINITTTDGRKIDFSVNKEKENYSLPKLFVYPDIEFRFNR